MGNTESMESQLAVIRARAAPVKLPMPDPTELEERFSIALGTLPSSAPHQETLPTSAPKQETLPSSAPHWLERLGGAVPVKKPPHTYIHRLPASWTRRHPQEVPKRVRVDPRTMKSQISLRTNHIAGSESFLNEENQGLNVLVNTSPHQYANT
ncbi:unnamed protein product [Arctogadus glacialis]